MPAASWNESRLRLAIIALVIAKAAGLVLVFDFTRALVQPFDLAKSAFSRVGEAAILGCALIALVRFGPKVFPSARIAIAAALVLAVNLAATVVAANRYLALFGAQDRYLGVTFLIDMLVLMLGTAIAFRTTRDWAVAGGVLAATTLLAAGYAAVQITGHDPIRWATDPRVRPFSTLGNADMFGEYLSVAIAVAMTVAALERRIVVRVGATTVLIVATLVAVVTATRGTAVAVAAAIPALAVVLVRTYGTDRSSLRRVAALAAIAVFAFGIVLAATPLGLRVRGTLTGEAVTMDRLLLFEASLRAFAARPLLGWGPDNFGVAYPLYRQVEVVRLLGPGLTSNSAHSWLFQTLVATGVAGLLALLGLIALAVQRLWSHLRETRTVAAALLVGSVAYWAHGLVTVGTISVDWFPWLAFGGAVALASDNVKPPTGRRWPAWVYALPLLLAVLALWDQTSVLTANGAIRVAGVALDLGAGQIAVSEGQAAVLSDDGRGEYWNALGRSYGAVQQYRESAGAFIEATRRMPHESTYWINLAKTRAQQVLVGDNSGGGKSAAIGAARTAVEKDPSVPEPLVALCDVTYALGDYDASLDGGLALIRMLPTSASYEGYAARAAIVVSDPAVARAKLEAILPIRESALLHLATAQVAVKQNDLVGARTHAHRALQLEPGNAGAQRLLATIGE